MLEKLKPVFSPALMRHKQIATLFHRTKTYSAFLKRRKSLKYEISRVKAVSGGNNPTANFPSLIAQKLAKQSAHLESQNEPDMYSHNDRSNIKSQLETLKSLTLEMDSSQHRPSLPSSSGENMSQFMSDNNQEDIIESIIFPSDLESSKQPSPILGTEDPSIPASNIPCIGCGALLQCQHQTFPGFLPSENFKFLSQRELRKSICQRCYYMQHCNAFVEVSTEPEEYKRMISQIKTTQSAIVLVVDVMDINGSIVPNLMEYIGRNHPIIVVGSKADLLAPDGPDYLRHVKAHLKSACYSAGLSNLHKVTLVSAKTGFGLERLINMLFSFHKRKVDMYIVGSANAGKSSLFNALLASDYCKSSARNLIDRATVSVWPGTTLSLLKFPITRPKMEVITSRHKRLRQEEAQRKMLQQIKRERSNLTNKTISTWNPTEEINTTDVRSKFAKEHDEKGTAWGQKIVGYQAKSGGIVQSSHSKDVMDALEYDPDKYKESYWTYDTPGIINPDQILNLLTPEELAKLAPPTMIVPRCVALRPGETLFISGLGRLDFVEGEGNIMLAVHSGPNIPIHVVPSSEADKFYISHCGLEMLGIPIGNRERLDRLPSLVAKVFKIFGTDAKLAVCDVQFSSIGWVSVSPERDHQATLRVFAPGRKGLFLRKPALLPEYLGFRGKRIEGTAFYRTRPPGWVMTRQRDKNMKNLL